MIGPDTASESQRETLVFGTLRPLVSSEPREAVSPAQMALTLEVMATSLVA